MAILHQDVQLITAKGDELHCLHTPVTGSNPSEWLSQCCLQKLMPARTYLMPVVTSLQNWDGSGGNGAAVRHFEATGKNYPLAVKLGTITPHSADVFSYAEDDMVTDPKLVIPLHLP